MNANNDTELARQRLTADFKAIIADGEELLHATAGQVGEKAGAVRERIQQKLRVAREKLDSVETGVVNRTRAAAWAADDYVHVHPWTTTAVAAGVGFLLGMLISRR
jgi:ElaB/YqjD/DUF883 family membrane-anchored ribosome-binding protein